MNYQIIQKSSFKLAGFLVDTPISGTSTADAPVYWENIPPNWEGVLYDRLNPPKHGEYCLCFPSDKEEEKLVYFMAVAVDDFSNVTDDIKTLEVPEVTYAVFTTQPVNQVGGINDDLFTAGIRSLWKYIFEEWFPESGFEYNMSGYDFEYYDERCHHTPNSVMEIYVPVKKANE